MLKKSIMIILVLMINISVIFACEMVAIKGLNGYNLSTSTTNGQDVSRLFNYFKILGYSDEEIHLQETNGFGLVVYLSNSSNTRTGVIATPNGLVSSDRKFAHYLANATQNPVNFNPGSTSLGILGHSINYGTMRTVLAHKRRSTSGDPDVPNPHPFVYRHNGRSYSFMHNGTIPKNGTHLGQIKAYIASNQSMLVNDSELNDILWSGASSSWPDSRLDSAEYFTYLLMHIKAQEFDVLRGIHTALNSLTYILDESNNQHNFILSDGYDIYAYKNSHHPLRFYYEKDKDIALVTSMNRNFNNASANSNLGFWNYHRNLENRSLLYIPGHGEPIVFENFTAQDQVVKMNRRLEQGNWYWYGLPLIPDNTTMTMKDLLIETYSVGHPTFTEMLALDRIEAQDGFAVFCYDYFSWAWGDTFYSTANANFGMKMLANRTNSLFMNNTNEKYHLSGKLAPIEPYTGTFLPYNQVTFPTHQVNRYWVTYNLTSGQTVQSALGQYFNRIRRVYADNWTYYDVYHQNPEAKDFVGTNSLNANRPMEFGKTYVIELKANAAPITNFKWTDSREPQLGFGKLNQKSDFFEYEQKMEYEAIDIISLSKNPEECVEIAVFANETCIGATKVDEFPVQILIYSEGYEGIPLTFRALYPNGMVSEINPVVESFDTKSGEMVNRVLIAGQVDYTIANLDNSKDNCSYEMPALITKHSVYPNPFNPSTTINFSIASKSNVTLDIFNIRGQKVANLFNDVLPSGNHFAKWDGKDQDNNSVASGMYFYKITTAHEQVISKMLLVK